MSKLVKPLIVALAAFSAFALSGCATSTKTDTAVSPSATTLASPEESSAPVVAPTTAQTSDPNAAVSLIDERSFLAAMKPLGFACDQSVVKAIEFSGTQVQFSTISCRRGSEADVVLTLAANQNELELVTLQSCKAVTGTQARAPIVAGGNWQLLSGASDRPLLEQLGKILQGKTMTIAQLCA